MRIAIVHNPVSSHDSVADRDVLIQVAAVEESLRRLGHEVLIETCTLDLQSLVDRLKALDVDAVFNLVESLGGSDMLAYVAPAVFAAAGLPFTGNSAEALLLTNHKLLAKERLAMHGLPTPAWRDLGGRDRFGWQPHEVGPRRAADAAARFIVKAASEHASLGLDEASVVDGGEGLPDRLSWAAARLGREAFAEEFIEGREFNVAVLGDGAGCRVLPVAEIEFIDFPEGKPRFVGYDAKWNDESFDYSHTVRRFDLPLEPELAAELAALSARCWQTFALAGYARVDFRVDRQGRPWILEINANPCLSPDAGFAVALEEVGVDYVQAVDQILQQALVRAGLPGRVTV